jgi:hypothetical protein
MTTHFLTHLFFPPFQLQDISTFRQVPDHQECFQSQEERPTLLVVEILSREEGVDDADAARFFFEDLAEHNGVESAEHKAFHPVVVVVPSTLTKDPHDVTLLVHAGEHRVRVCAGIGFQKQVPMGRDYDQEGNSRRHLQELQTIRVDLVVLRLLEQETDLLITLSTPMATSDLQAAFTAAVQTSIMSPFILQAVSTLKVQDWGLFG